MKSKLRLKKIEQNNLVSTPHFANTMLYAVFTFLIF